MAKLLSLYLIVTGGVSLVVLAMPGLVLVGFMALILPGLILSLFPTAFLWGATFAAIWMPLRLVMGDLAGAIVAGVLSAAVMIAIPKAYNRPFHTEAAAAQAEDRMPAARIALSGTVRLTIPYAPWRKEKDGLVCDTACHAILYTPGVTAVILEEGPGRPKPMAPVQLRLEKRSGGCETSVKPISEKWGDVREREALTKSWLIRQAGGECVIRETPGLQPDFHVRLETNDRYVRTGWTLSAAPVSFRRVVVERITGGKPETLLRRTFTWGRPLIAPLMAVPEGSMEDFRFRWGRETGKDYKGEGHFVPIEMLRDQTNAALVPDLKAMGDAVRVQIGAALGDPGRPESDAAFALAPALLEDIAKNGPREGDRELLVRLVGDPRVSEVHRLWDATRKFDGGVPELRAPIVHRLLTVPPQRDKGDSILGEWLGQLPEGSFATLTAEEEALLTDPVRRGRAGGLIRRLADRGAASLPMLVGFIGEEKVNYPARMALCAMGPVAAPALAQVEAKLNGPHYSRDWQITLARMGKPIESFRAEPGSNWDDARVQKRLREQLARFDVTRDCR